MLVSSGLHRVHLCALTLVMSLHLATAAAQLNTADTPRADSAGQTSEQQTTRLDSIRRVLLDPSDPHVLVVSHRGHHREHPENSIAAIEAAIEAGAHVVEIDVMLTADGHAVLMHDRTIDRTTFASGTVAEMTLDELRQHTLRHNLRPSTERIPTLVEALEAARGRAMLNIDPKDLDIRKAAEIAERAGLLDHCIFKQWWKRMDRDTIEWFAAHPDAIFMPICESEAEIDAALAAHPWPAIEVLVRSPESPMWSREFTTQLRDRGVMPWINTLWNGRISGGLGDRAAAFEPDSVFGPVIEMGWGMIQTDLPELLIEAVNRRNLLPAGTEPVANDTRTTRNRARVRDGLTQLRLAQAGVSNTPLIIAHRGYTLREAENSLAAIDAAADLGVAGVTVSLRRTGDGRYVLMHDETIERTTHVRGLTGKSDSRRVADLSADVLTQLRLKHGIYPTNQHVPTLEQALAAASGRLLLVLDLKEGDVREVIEQARAWGSTEDVVIPFVWSDTSADTRLLLANQENVLAVPRLETQADADEAMKLTAWPAVIVEPQSTTDAVWSAEAIARRRDTGTLTWIATLDHGPPAIGLGDRDMLATDPSGTVDPLVDRGVMCVETTMPLTMQRALRNLDAPQAIFDRTD
ncbi:MAG: glycerophosphodiester phosphodiesterase family protein [Planctomycetota bacterium]